MSRGGESEIYAGTYGVGPRKQANSCALGKIYGERGAGVMLGVFGF